MPRKGVFSHVINECTTICYEKIQNMSRASKNCLLAKKILYPTKKKCFRISKEPYRDFAATVTQYLIFEKMAYFVLCALNCTICVYITF